MGKEGEGRLGLGLAGQPGTLRSGPGGFRWGNDLLHRGARPAAVQREMVDTGWGAQLGLLK